MDGVRLEKHCELFLWISKKYLYLADLASWYILLMKKMTQSIHLRVCLMPAKSWRVQLCRKKINFAIDNFDQIIFNFLHYYLHTCVSIFMAIYIRDGVFQWCMSKSKKLAAKS